MISNQYFKLSKTDNKQKRAGGASINSGTTIHKSWMENTSKACINVVELLIKIFDAYLKLATILQYTWPRVPNIAHTF